LGREKFFMKKPIRSFRDLEVYQNTYRASIVVMTEIVPNLPDSEKYDLKDQLSRSSKAIPRLIAEGYAKRQQKRGFQKYIEDALAECNETIVSLEQCKDIYPKYIDQQLCDRMIKLYDQSGRQLYRLGESWTNFKRK
jgi:four helix bundle protein